MAVADDPRIAFILAKIYEVEGGYSNHPDDRGGATMFGITEAVARANGYNGPMNQLPREVADDIYARQYIAPFSGIEHLGTQTMVVSMGVNAGPARGADIASQAIGAGRTLQGEELANAINAYVAEHGPQAFAERFREERLEFYRGLGNYGTFGRGWENRANSEAALWAVDDPSDAPVELPPSQGGTSYAGMNNGERQMQLADMLGNPDQMIAAMLMMVLSGLFSGQQQAPAAAAPAAGDGEMLLSGLPAQATDASPEDLGNFSPSGPSGQGGQPSPSFV